jgi:flagellar motor switch protein FliN/FliY
MNQMMGSSATSMSSMLGKTIDISPPVADVIDLQESVDEGAIDEFLSGTFVKISFKMEIGDLVDSEIMQLYPFSFAREMCRAFKKNMEVDADEAQIGLEESTAPSPAPAPAPQAEDKNMTNQQIEQPQSAPQQMSQPQMMYQQPVNVQPAQFTPFSGEFPAQFAKENIDLIMDVPLEVTVELGRTSKSISEILDFAPGTIIELNRIAGEPIDVLVNGKYVAKGEVVVIEESFGIRITEIVK